MVTDAARYRRLAGGLTLAIVALQGAVVAVFVVDRGDPPPGGSFWQELGLGLWALEHKASFIPLIALALVGPPATWLAWSVPGRHRRRLVAAWLIFGAIAATGFAYRIWVMSRLVWEHAL